MLPIVNFDKYYFSIILQLNGDVHIYHDSDDDRVELLRSDVEEETNSNRRGQMSSPPSYFGQSDALCYQMKRLKAKVEQLNTLHKQHLDRPAFDDSNQEEAQINALTREISEVCTTKYLIPG